jgi:signal transduction histidine kinase
MSHEIRTPMNAVIGFSDLLSKRVTDKRHKSYLSSIQTASKTLLTLINDILDLAKIEAGRLDIQLETIDPRVIFAELKQLFSLKMADKGLEFRVEIDEALPLALVLDENRLRQVLLNLIGNAVKFTERGHVKIRVQTLRTGLQTPSSTDNTLDLIIAVEDTGIGIPKNQQDHIFEAFQQMDGQLTKKYGGTGLGLAITKRLIEMMNGQITIQSQVGLGSIFEITLRDVKVSEVALPVKTDDTFDVDTISFEHAMNFDDFALFNSNHQVTTHATVWTC